MAVKESWDKTKDSKLTIALLGFVIAMFVTLYVLILSSLGSGIIFSIIEAFMCSMIVWFLAAVINSLYKEIIEIS